MTDHPELSFFNGLSGILEIQISEEPTRFSPRLLNLQSPPTARLVSLEIRMGVFVDGEVEPDDSIRELTDDEWSSVAFDAPRIALQGISGNVMTHEAPDGCRFTVRDLAAAVAATERAGRSTSQWLGGIDVHHIFFEGLDCHRELEDVWRISWGS